MLQFIENLLWAYYIKHTASGSLLRAAVYGELITLVGVVGFYSWLKSFWFVIPTVIGGFLGTYYSGKLEVKKPKHGI